MGTKCSITNRHTIFLGEGQVESTDEELIKAAQEVDDEEAAMIAEEAEENQEIPPAPSGKRKGVSICLAALT